MTTAGPCRFRRAALSFTVFTSHNAGRATVSLAALSQHTLGSRVSQERAESAAKAEVDAKAIAVLKGTVHDLTLKVARLEERADSETTRTTATTRKIALQRKRRSMTAAELRRKKSAKELDEAVERVKKKYADDLESALQTGMFAGALSPLAS